MSPQPNISALSMRIQKLETEARLVKMRQQDEAKRAISALKCITPEQVSLLAPIVPELSAVVEYTVDDLISNQNNEIETLHAVFGKLSGYVVSRLSYYENGLAEAQQEG